MKKYSIFRLNFFAVFILFVIMQIDIIFIGEDSSSLFSSKNILFAQNTNPKKEENPQKKIEASKLYEFGFKLYVDKNYQEAIPLLLKALEIYTSIVDKKGQREALNTIGNIYQIQKKNVEAIDLYKKSLQISKEIGDQLGILKTLINLGGTYEKLSQYALAIENLNQALKISASVGTDTEKGALFSNLGQVFTSIGQYENAIKFHEQALKIRRQLQDKKREGITLNNLGWAYLKSGEFDNAVLAFQDSLVIRRSTQDKFGEIYILNNLGDLYYQQKEYDKSLDVLNLALNISREIKFNQMQGQILDGIATVYKKLEKYDLAQIFYLDALRVIKITKEKHNEAKTLSNLGDLFAKQGNESVAIAFYKKSVQTTEAIRQDLTSLPIEQQKSYAETVAYTYRALADLLLSQGRVLEAQQVLELLKIQEIRDFTKNTRAGGTEEPTKLSPKESSVFNPIDGLIKLGLEIEKCQNCSDAVKKDLNDRRMAVTEEFNNTVDLLEKDSKDRLAKDDGFFRPEKIKSKSEDIVRSQPNTVLIYTFVQKDRTWILWASKGAITKSIEVPKIGREQISKLVFELRSQLSEPNTDIKQLKSTSKKIYDILIPPSLQAELDKNNIQNLVFSLDSVTRYVPMSVLFDGNQYLLEKYTISNLISADLINTTDRLPTDKQKINVLAAGVSQKFEGFDPLSNVPIELNAIVKSTQNVDGIFNGKQLLNQEFTRTSLRDNISGSNILHIATHGRFVPVDANASFLLLGNGDKLFIKELKNLIDDLNQVHLVVLSACQTALGTLGDDGVEISGISYYFLNGGAKAVIASLWAVNDDSTRQLMQHFYANLVTNGTQSPITKVKALQKAQLSLLHSDNESQSAKTKSGQVVIEKRSLSNVQTRSKTSFAHPYYWAPFILIGNGL